MTRNSKIALLVGAAVIAGGTSLAFAQMDAPPPPNGPMEGLVQRDRFADRLLREFDTNHDGKITRAEFNNVLGTRFAAATHGAKFMTSDQFAAIHQGNFQRHAAAMFRRIDWNGDGKLTLDEYAAPQRAHFQMMDRDGSGTVPCNPARGAGFERPPPDAMAPDADGDDRGDRRARFGGRGGFGGGFDRGGRGFGGFALAQFCNDNDIGRDGKVTRAELDQAMLKRFQAATGGAPTMSQAQFIADLSKRYAAMNDRMFKRLDTDGDGKLSLAEYSESMVRLFARLDRNNDGVITADELRPRFQDRNRGRNGPPPK
jgi:Ca2+-binding EF-hand superfamily protein